MAAPPQEGFDVTETPYPAATKTDATSIKGVETTATAMYFADKVMITITQNGRLAHWVRETIWAYFALCKAF